MIDAFDNESCIWLLDVVMCRAVRCLLFAVHDNINQVIAKPRLLQNTNQEMCVSIKSKGSLLDIYTIQLIIHAPQHTSSPSRPRHILPHHSLRDMPLTRAASTPNAPNALMIQPHVYFHTLPTLDTLYILNFFRIRHSTNPGAWCKPPLHPLYPRTSI